MYPTTILNPISYPLRIVDATGCNKQSFAMLKALNLSYLIPPDLRRGQPGQASGDGRQQHLRHDL